MGEIFPVEVLREQFPILSREVWGCPLVYFDNGATTQKPRCVMEALERTYLQTNANIHRGVHSLSQESTEAYEAARATVAEYLGAPDRRSVIFTAGTTASINLLASSLGESYFRPGDVILVSEMEHHSNLVPWQLIAQRKGLTVQKIPVRDDASLDMEALSQLLQSPVRLVAVAHVSNVTGRVNPIREIAHMAHSAGALLLVDGAQGVKHMAPIDVEELGADFYAFSSHKIYGPTGVGILWGRLAMMQNLPPWQGGGDMVGTVSFEGTTFAELPFRLEAGTPPYNEAIALGEALRFYRSVGVADAVAHENALLRLAYDGVSQLKGFQVLGYDASNAGILSLYSSTMHPYDVGTLLDKMGIAVRTGTHCAEPLMRRFGLSGTLRASFAMYNTVAEVQHFVESLARIQQMLS